MQAFGIVLEFDVTKDALTRILTRGWDAAAEVVEALGFKSRPKAFHGGVVVAVAKAANAVKHTLIP